MIPFPILQQRVHIRSENKNKIQYDNINKIKTIEGKTKIKR
jgi:hypothetical protein